MDRPVWQIRALGALVVFAVAAMGAGCSSAPRRYALDISIPQQSNLAQGRTVVIAEVRDSRRFADNESVAKDAASQQLAAGDADDPSVTARALGQARHPTGMLAAEYLLPAGRTVADLTRDALANGFRLAGIRVLASNDPVAPEAIPIDAEVVRFWFWNTGSWVFTIHFEADVLVRGALRPFDLERIVEGRATLQDPFAVGSSQFTNVMAKGLENLTEQVARSISAAR